MNIYPTHVYVLSMIEISFDYSKWTLTLFLICYLPNVLKDHNIFTHHVFYDPDLDWSKKNDISNKLSNFCITK
jgi:hypothetical protein